MEEPKKRMNPLGKIKTGFHQFWLLFKEAIKQANKRVVEQKSFSYGIYFQEILFMLIMYFNKKIHKFIFYAILLIMYSSVLIVSNQKTMTLNFISLFVFYFIVVPYTFTFTMKLNKEVTNMTYIKLQLLYLLIPILATIQYLVIENWYFLIASLIPTTFCPTYIYGCLKNAKITKKHIGYLKFYNFAFTSCFTIIFYIINIYKDLMSNLLFVCIISPLLFLHIAYEKLLLDIE